MSFSVFLKRSAEKELDNLPPSIHDRVISRLLPLSNQPRPPGAIKLQGREAYRIRVGDYRILYLISDRLKRVDVISIAHRKEVYR